MDDYISREELLEHLDKCRLDPLFDPDMARICFAIGIFVENMKSADVQTVRHGRWLPSEACITIDCQVCSEFRSNIIMDRFYYDYCPVCGVRMDGETNG